MKRKLILENGAVFMGTALGAKEDSFGEVVFQTGMTGYQEIMSDPSYAGQIITMTYPLIGNYGINRDDFESMKPALRGVVVKNAAKDPSHHLMRQSLDEWLRAIDVPGITGVDTRMLTRMIREQGAMRGAIVPFEENTTKVLEILKSTKPLAGQVREVSTKTTYANPGYGKRVVLIDYGMKKGILRDLLEQGYDVIVVPYNTTSKEILSYAPDGLVLSNGPGDPADIPEAIEALQDLIGMVPLFGICLGHQLLARACGAGTFKMKFGHRGSNHPVRDLSSGRIAITSQNHGYAIDAASLEQTPFEITHRNVNDDSVEGIRHRHAPAFSVQYHPEASAGPEDAKELFIQFDELMNQHAGRKYYAETN
ncbi:glutamine-hydrolyzing carbamoyl-phosphate synthase small subunit [Salisediminibacterium beveridgei]|uniref:Carbamoyl phosphate synthase small chain n=1 Tax=Salisediminibacterium beveridgei TaxID=632773 RepID=A0A1D7QW63_9BACI|nr:glutamine-hydrolyzing carbamoyl-phosphate synthase small subunit [Salisediminibacterium beveridgei]AOM83254.1 Carbamoyl-phosphate synthase small chain [Salisediminibacterium beveridgei]